MSSHTGDRPVSQNRILWNSVGSRKALLPIESYVFGSCTWRPEANIKVGQWKAPFGLEQITPDTKILTIERSLPTGALTPERQLGVQIWGKPLTNLWPDQPALFGENQ